MKPIKVAIIGWGNVGRFSKRAVEESPDMQLKGVVRRIGSIGKNMDELADVPVVADINDLGDVDVAILSVPSRQAAEKASELLRKGICTVDSFDIHDQIWDVKQSLDPVAKKYGSVCIFGAGWDPGTDSAIRAMMQMVCPKGVTTTTFGGQKGGRSMGHTAAVKAIAGVKDAVALTFPNGPGKHKRQVYIELEKGAVFEKVAKAVRKDAYFVNDPTDVVAVDDIAPYDTLNHGGLLERPSAEIVQRYEVEGVNPYMTANVLVSAVRAAWRAKEQGAFGAYTLIERPLADYLPGTLQQRLNGY